jgi:hypothetical protein
MNLRRQATMEMEAYVTLPSMSFQPCYTQQDICSLIHSNRISQTLIYFSPEYSLDDKGKGELLADLQKAALAGGDVLSSWGRGRGKDQVMYLRCQCSIIYRGSKVDKVSGSIVERTDYRNTTYSNDRKNNRHGQKGKNSSHKTSIDRRLNKGEARCMFTLAVFKDENGFYLKTKNCTAFHQFHARRDHLRTPVSLLLEEELQLQEDLNSARAKLGTAANLLYVRSSRQGTPTVLSRQQIAHLCNKKQSSVKDGSDGAVTGETDD